jgi:hypothetical protein
LLPETKRRRWQLRGCGLGRSGPKQARMQRGRERRRKRRASW